MAQALALPGRAEESKVSTSAGSQVVPLSAETSSPVPPVASEAGAAATVMYQIVPSVGRGAPSDTV